MGIGILNHVSDSPRVLRYSWCMQSHAVYSALYSHDSIWEIHTCKSVKAEIKMSIIFLYSKVQTPISWCFGLNHICSRCKTWYPYDVVTFQAGLRLDQVLNGSTRNLASCTSIIGWLVKTAYFVLQLKIGVSREIVTKLAPGQSSAGSIPRLVRIVRLLWRGYKVVWYFGEHIPCCYWMESMSVSCLI